MNYYERIQKSIDYMEDNIEKKINIVEVAKIAHMSMSVFYRMFFSMVGFTVKEYIRNRRFSNIAIELKSTDQNIIDIAMKYDYENADSFSRSFQNTTGFLPSEFRKNSKQYLFERIDIIEKYFETLDEELLEKYPDIKVLKKLESMKVAYYNFYGKNPEQESFAVMTEWIKSNQKILCKENYRIFGYNKPSPKSSEQEEYGYEVCVTIDGDVSVHNDKVKTKILEDGKYVTIHIKHKNKDVELGYEIMKGWERINSWMKDSKYDFGEHQWFEEHIGFDKSTNSFSEVELYIPIKNK